MTLNTLILTARNLRHATSIIREQQQIIREQRELLDELGRIIQRNHLDFVTEMEGLVAGWLIHCDRPDVDLREDLSALMSRLSDQRATLEEHVC